jgi:hypothetical protein
MPPILRRQQQPKPRSPLQIATELQQGLTAAAPAELVAIQLSCLTAVCGVMLTDTQRKAFAAGQTPSYLTAEQVTAVESLTSVLVAPEGQPEYSDTWLFAPPADIRRRRFNAIRKVQVDRAKTLDIVSALVASPPSWATVVPPSPPVPAAPAAASAPTLAAPAADKSALASKSA